MTLPILALTMFLQTGAGGVVPFGRSCERSMRDAPTAAPAATPIRDAVPWRAPASGAPREAETAADVARQLAIGAILGPA